MSKNTYTKQATNQVSKKERRGREKLCLKEALSFMKKVVFDLDLKLGKLLTERYEDKTSCFESSMSKVKEGGKRTVLLGE